jgi:DNA-binding protein HU-beta
LWGQAFGPEGIRCDTTTILARMMDYARPYAYLRHLTSSTGSTRVAEEAVNKAELVAALETRLGSRKAAADALEAVIDTIQRAVVRGEKVAISGFGSFEKAVRNARTGRNPRTGEKVRIKKTSVPRFRPGTAFKGYVADPRSMPRQAAPAKTAAKTTTRTTSTRSTAKAPAKRAPASTARTTKTTAKAPAKRATATKTTAKRTTKKTTAKTAAKRTTRA